MKKKAKIVEFSGGSAWVYVGRTIYSFPTVFLAREYCETHGYVYTEEEA